MRVLLGVCGGIAAHKAAEPVLNNPKTSKISIARSVFDLVVPAVLGRGAASKRAAS